MIPLIKTIRTNMCVLIGVTMRFHLCLKHCANVTQIHTYVHMQEEIHLCVYVCVCGHSCCVFYRHH